MLHRGQVLSELFWWAEECVGVSGEAPELRMTVWREWSGAGKEDRNIRVVR